jgi:hypothetical protein
METGSMMAQLSRNSVATKAARLNARFDAFQVLV